ncbi:polysaccharide export protein [Flavobacteriaceae bacterium R38]|nr:polysaccharide export protein [Flavobacteriaceae bacterium R38]
MLKKRIVFLSIITLLIVSCTSKKEIVYFQNAKDFETVVNTDTFTPKFKINDILSITISAFDLEAVRPFNLVRETGGTGGTREIDYLIDKDGYIDYPILGKIKLLGLTIEEAKALFKEKLKEYLKDPIVNIRIQNFRISVLGEVNNPGTYQISGERITILEALGLASDLTIKGRRDNVMVIRDFDGTKTYTRIDLTTKESLNSPVYYLTQNDIVYVEPNKSAISASKSDGRIGTILTIASIVITTSAIIITRN